MKSNKFKPLLDFTLLLIFISSAGYLAYHYSTAEKSTPEPDLELQADAEGIDLKELLKLCRETPAAPASPAIIPPKLSNQWEYIVVHHSATLSGNAEIFAKHHTHKGMKNGLAYHFVITNGHGAANGAIQIGNRWLNQLPGGHVKGDEINEKAIGICLVGDFNRVAPTKKQIASLKGLLQQLMDLSNISKAKISGHKKMPGQATACPGLLPINECLRDLKNPANNF